jgi:hypothetical protein
MTTNYVGNKLTSILISVLGLVWLRRAWGLSEESTHNFRTVPSKLYRDPLASLYGLCSSKLPSLRLTVVNPSVGLAAFGARAPRAPTRDEDANKTSRATQIQDRAWRAMCTQYGCDFCFAFFSCLLVSRSRGLLWDMGLTRLYVAYIVLGAGSYYTWRNWQLFFSKLERIDILIK